MQCKRFELTQSCRSGSKTWKSSATARSSVLAVLEFVILKLRLTACGMLHTFTSGNLQCSTFRNNMLSRLWNGHTTKLSTSEDDKKVFALSCHNPSLLCIKRWIV